LVKIESPVSLMKRVECHLKAIAYALTRLEQALSDIDSRASAFERAKARLQAIDDALSELERNRYTLDDERTEE